MRNFSPAKLMLMPDFLYPIGISASRKLLCRNFAEKTEEIKMKDLEMLLESKLTSREAVRNRRREDRKHKAENWQAEKAHRKDVRWDHNVKAKCREWNILTVTEIRIRNAERSLRNDLNAEIAEHEKRMAEYSELLRWADYCLDTAEIILDRSLEYETPEEILGDYAYEKRMAENHRRDALQILAGEIY